MRKILFIAILILSCANLCAQNTFGNQYGSSASGRGNENFDRNGNPIDTTAVNDANTIPVGLFAWKVGEYLGEKLETPIDTIMHGFQNTNYTGGPTRHYTYLGNLGSPRIAHVYFDRKETTQYFFTDPYDFTVKKAGDVVYTNTLSPFTNLTYYKQGDGRHGEERFKAYFAVNVNKRLGFGFDIDYTYGRGKYADQSTALFNGNLFSYYHGDKYEMHFNFINENLKVAENGGISDDRYITHPLDMAEGKKQYQSNMIPTNLNDVWNKNTGYHAFLTHRYNLGFYRDVKAEKDTVAREVFVPVTSFIHTLKADFSKRKYYSYDYQQSQKIYEHNYLGRDSLDRTNYMSVKNTIGLALREGFSKWSKFGLTAFASFEHRQFTLTDTITDNPGQRLKTDHKENIFSIGGQLIKEKGKLIHYNVLGEIAMAGEDAGQFNIEGNGDLNFKLLKDTVRLDVKAFIKNQNPIFYYRHFHSKHYWWDNNDLSKIMRTKVEGKLSIDHWKTQLKIGFENIKNYTYLDNVSVGYEKAPTGNGKQPDVTPEKTYKNDVKISQCGSNIQVFSASLRQDFKLGILHLDNEITYQKSSNNNVLPLPELVLYHDLYLQFSLAKKVLNIEMGADFSYFTKYYAPDYAPAIGQFYLQNPEKRMKLGNYPMVNAYINLHLKRTRIFVQMYNLVQMDGENSYIYSPHYPLNPRILKIGISWNFFD